MHDFSVLIAVCAGDKEEYFEAALKSVYDQSTVANQVVLVADGPLNQSPIGKLKPSLGLSKTLRSR